MRALRSATGVGLALWLLAGSASAAPRVGQPAPDFTVTTFGGQTVKLADLKGDVIVLNFWATWCGPCLKELPLLEALFKSYNKYDFQVLAVATEDSVPQSKLRPLATQLTIPLVKHLSGPYRQLEGVPTNYVIDRSGKLVYAKAGAFNVEAFNTLIVPLLKEPLPAPAPSASGASTDPATPSKPTSTP